MVWPAALNHRFNRGPDSTPYPVSPIGPIGRIGAIRGSSQSFEHEHEEDVFLVIDSICASRKKTISLEGLECF
jgi:hypothetical protein